VHYRVLGRTGLQVSALGFGCGNVGGLMVRGAPKERERAIARALDLGINYFDTAAQYGDGLSEQHLGEAIRALGVRSRLYYGTKFRVGADDMKDIGGAVTRSLEASLRRLGLESGDLLQCHNLILPARQGDRLSVEDFLSEVVPALEALQLQGKVRYIGITALGDTAALHRVVASRAFHTAQVCFNLLNPSAGHAVPPGFPGQNFDRLLDRCDASQVGVIVIRVLAAGALSGLEARHPVAVPTVDPIASGPDYSTDVARAQRLRVLVDEGHAADLVEASLRFALSAPAVSTVLLGYSSMEHLEHAAASVAKGPLSRAALDRLAAIWAELARAA
jgi:aryl-alcohol dehydrogenase-like predicted oxidoreductase